MPGRRELPTRLMLLCCATEKWSIAKAPLADHVYACGVVRLKRCKDWRLETQSCRHPKDSRSWYIHASLPDASGAHSSWSTFEMAVRLAATVPHALAQTNMWLSVRIQNWIYTYLRFQAGKILGVLPTNLNSADQSTDWQRSSSKAVGHAITRRSTHSPI